MWFSALSCRRFVVSPAACHRLGPRGVRPPFPFHFELRLFLFLFTFSRLLGTSPAGCVLACPGCPFLRCFGGRVVMVGWVSPGRAGWSSGVLLWGPVGVAFGVAWLVGLPAFCRVGARLCGWVTISCPPLFFSLSAGACSWFGGGPCPPVFFFFCGGGLPVPPSASLGWCTHWSAFGVAYQLLLVLHLAGPCPGPTGYVRASPGGLPCRVRFWLCRLGGCASRFREVLG